MNLTDIEVLANALTEVVALYALDLSASIKNGDSDDEEVILDALLATRAALEAIQNNPPSVFT